MAIEARSAPSSSMPSALNAPRSAMGPHPKYVSSSSLASSRALRGASHPADPLPAQLNGRSGGMGGFKL